MGSRSWGNRMEQIQGNEHNQCFCTMPRMSWLNVGAVLWRSLKAKMNLIKWDFVSKEQMVWWVFKISSALGLDDRHIFTLATFYLFFSLLSFVNIESESDCLPSFAFEWSLFIEYPRDSQKYLRTRKNSTICSSDKMLPIIPPGFWYLTKCFCSIIQSVYL